MKKSMLLFGAFFITRFLFAQTIYYVSTSGNDVNSGTSWSAAFQTVQKALATAGSGSQIWVAQGAYYPDEGAGKTNDDRTASFALKNGVALYGGFAGTETSPGERDWTTHVTILSGDIDQNDGPGFLNNGGNSYFVVLNNLLNNTAVLDGFTITAGNANSAPWNNLGGGMYNDNSSPTLSNCVFSGNNADGGGGGMFNYNRSAPKLANCIFSGNSAVAGGGMYNLHSSPNLTGCGFSGNSADFYGGGMYSSTSSPVLTNCSFSGNSAATWGGGMYNNGSPALLTNCSFSENRADYGGGMYNNGSSATLTNCSFSENRADFGGGMYNDGSSPKLTNCIFSGNNASDGGGMSNNDGSSPKLTNCTFSGNGAFGIANINSSPTLTNCILWGDANNSIRNHFSNPVINNSIAQLPNVTFFGTNNKSENPQFVNAAGGNLRLRPCSPAINAGSNSANSTAKDLDGNDRIHLGTIDMGAYEFRAAPNINRLYVNAAVPTNSGDGLSWATAYKNLQDALSVACIGITEIWVARGTYYPDEGGGKANNDRTAGFRLINGVAVYGGFAGTETSLGQRDWKTNVTILSGDIDQNDGPDFSNNSGNSYHVVFNDFFDADDIISNTAMLNGFTITAGNAHGAQNPFGGGIYNHTHYPTLVNLRFLGNRAANGGGMYNFRSRSRLINCSFSGNSATTGGGIYNVNTFGTLSNLVNCSFSGNSATTAGGMYNQTNTSGAATLTNCVFWGNTGGEIHNASGTHTIRYSIVQGGCPAGANCTNVLDADPLFVDAAGSDLRLQGGSPAIDAGLNSANTTTTDLDGNPRMAGCAIDMGAYEYQDAPAFITMQPLASQTLCLNAAPVDLSVTASCGNLTYQWYSNATNSNSGGTAINLATSSAYTPPTAIAGTFYYYVVVTGASRSEASGTATVTVNEPPVITSVTAPVSPVVINTLINLSVSFAGNNAASAVINWDDQTLSETINNPSNNFTVPHTYSKPGVYSVTVIVTNACGQSTFVYNYVVVYDPNGGFITGGGWIHSPAGAYIPDPSMTGKANFGFVCKYHNGSTVPQGSTEFQFHAAGLNFKSTAYENMRLVISSYKANFKGEGKLNGAAGYRFLLSAIDGQINGGGGVDKFRIKIWNQSTGVVVYDNNLIHQQDEDAIPETAIAGGSIIIHEAKGKTEVNDSQRSIVETERPAVNKLTVMAKSNPNPTHFTLVTQSGSDRPLTVSVTDMLGRMIEYRTGISANGRMDIGSSYRPGTYFVRIVQGKAGLTLKLIKTPE